MKKHINLEREAWNNVRKLLGNRQAELGQHWSYNLRTDPKRLGFVLSRYKFVAKMAAGNKRILELGCSEGIGVPILSEFAACYTGVDMDGPAIETAKKNWASDKASFIEGEFLGKTYGVFDTVVSLDVVEHIVPDSEPLFFETICDNLKIDGIGVVGTPNISAAAYASAASTAGHVNMFDADRLRQAMERLFRNVFIFGMNDEMVNTGFAPMAHHLLCLGCGKKNRGAL